MDENYVFEKDRMFCKKCNKWFSREGCDMAFGCTCSAHTHIENHLTWGFTELPKFKNMTTNELERRRID